MGNIIIIAIVGIAFYFLSKSFRQNPSINQINLDEHKVFKGDLEKHEAGMLIALLAKVAKSDGKVSELEAKLIQHTLDDISNAFENKEEVREKLKAIYEKEKNNFSNVLSIASAYHATARFNYQSRLNLLGFLLALAFIDGDYSKDEQLIIKDIADELKIKKQDYERLANTFKTQSQQRKSSSSMELEEAYKLLGLNQDASAEQIKKAYRNLVRKTHPDILLGQNADKQSIEDATKKLQNINEAYELIKKTKLFK